MKPGLALINPFDPRQTTVKVTSNRRRWTHIFPKGPSGQYQHLHQHHDSHDFFQHISASAASFREQGLTRSTSVDMSIDDVWNPGPQTGKGISYKIGQCNNYHR